MAVCPQLGNEPIPLGKKGSVFMAHPVQASFSP